jgi:hypothetical protein
MAAAIHRAMASLLQRRAMRESLVAQGLKVHALPPAQFNTTSMTSSRALATRRPQRWHHRRLMS